MGPCCHCISLTIGLWGCSSCLPSLRGTSREVLLLLVRKEERIIFPNQESNLGPWAVAVRALNPSHSTNREHKTICV